MAEAPLSPASGNEFKKNKRPMEQMLEDQQREVLNQVIEQVAAEGRQVSRARAQKLRQSFAA